MLLAANTGSSSDSGKVPECGSDGKLSENVIPAATTSSIGGVQLAYTGGSNSDDGKVPILVDNGKLNESVLPIAGTSNYGIVRLASNSGSSSDSGAVPICVGNGKLSENVLPTANSSNYGAVRLASNTGDSSDNGKVPECINNGKLSANVIPAATTSDLGGVQLATNTGDSADNGRVPVLGADGKLNANVLPANLFDYEVTIDGDNVYLRIKDAKDVWMEAIIDVLGIAEVIKINQTSQDIFGTGFHSTIEVYNRCYENGSSKWKKNDALNDIPPYSGNDIYLLVGTFSYSHGTLSTTLTGQKVSFKVINEISF